MLIQCTNNISTLIDLNGEGRCHYGWGDDVSGTLSRHTVFLYLLNFWIDMDKVYVQ